MGNMPTVMRWCAELEEALKPFDARPHWGKLFAMDKHELERIYGREALETFAELAEEHDPERRFVNDWAERLIFGEGDAISETEAMLVEATADD